MSEINEAARIAAAEKVLRSLFLDYTLEAEKAEDTEEDAPLDVLTALWALESGMTVSDDPDKFGTFAVAMAAWVEAEKESVRHRELLAAVREHAQANYETSGWDILVEAWEDKEIIEEIGDATTPEEAIARIQAAVKLQADYRQEWTPMPGWHF